MSHAALRYALGAGLRLTGYAHLLSSRSLPRPAYYVPSGPALF